MSNRVSVRVAYTHSVIQSSLEDLGESLPFNCEVFRSPRQANILYIDIMTILKTPSALNLYYRQTK